MFKNAVIQDDQKLLAKELLKVITYYQANMNSISN